MKILFHFSFAILLLTLTACDNTNNSNNIITLSGPTMGTVYTVKIADLNASTKYDALKTNIEKLLVHINQLMSTYLDDSELSLINQSDSTDWLKVSDELWKVMQEARQISVLSDGAFDVTVGPLVNLWGFGPEEVTNDMLPDEKTIADKRQITGYEKIEYHVNEKKIRKQHAEIYIDLSAIAKGYAVDEVAELLDQYGYENYMVDIGGELKTKGIPSEERGWRLGLEKPVVDNRSVHKILELNGLAMATSGDYRNFFEVDGKHYSHTINPKTGKPVEHKLASVSVLHDSAMRGDALATALNVLGPEDGLQLAEEQNVAAYFIVYEGEQYKEFSTHGFEQYVVESLE